MANLPLLLSLADDLGRLSMVPFYEPYYCQRRRGNPYLSLAGPIEQQLRQLEKQMGAGGPSGAMPNVGKDGFQVSMDVAHFKPSELSVKVQDNSVLVEGKHEEREDDHGFITRHFVRRYALPEGYDAEKVASTLSSDGVLTVSIPKPPAIEDKGAERVVQIQQVGPAHLNIKQNEQLEQDNGTDK
ncbi:GL22443 [Drosophila persimilis]|uniref:Heat shock protein 23-like n=2 Tax=pseudoobscura subgroup TaxID=32358 RepID=A0A6I8UEQ9_DROPS|nr:heat shock protein 23 [Drosophila pseudoobscura]XP_002024748.1 heat shock protein 23 [Drosophila persimilis]XP_002024750.1 heat shock protein 23 [Drosophila persimilis]EDW30196.1 GL22446 [Drosophila persimilis]EDW30198.1 GL22443 [Drosophila persimilis]